MTVRVVLPFKDQSSASYAKELLNNLSSKLNVTVQPVFLSPKLEQQLKGHEIKPLLSTYNVSYMNLNVTYVIQGMWVIHVDTYPSA